MVLRSKRSKRKPGERWKNTPEWNTNPDNKKGVKLIPEMLNLLGCSKDNFLKLIQEMNYKTSEKNNEFYFKYVPVKQKVKKSINNVQRSDNPFNVLKNISFK